MASLIGMLCQLADMFGLHGILAPGIGARRFHVSHRQTLRLRHSKLLSWHFLGLVKGAD